ncbi:gustatory receptor 106 [Tribolium castaneum]|uniref:Gustatory receptor n=1 Tax=Tribolium castaneum TaxID=7070 RepID=D6WRP3_TRICA|nr:PREDICTED: uncharacterized protein LOC103313745 [Tribolium castaneum]EFA07603.1 gustatory receptor 106 [Tribolium castaneum]|eukprot:XP_008196056.2 PREDICTED: uncharacterized protein LOC103313745 [Tribolium castaneum]
MNMILKLSLKDIVFINPLVKYLNIFFITPWYDFPTNQKYYPSLAKCYACLLMVVKILWVIYWLQDDALKSVYASLLCTEKIFLFAIYTNLSILTTVTIFKSAFWDVDKWRTLFTNLQYIDINLQNKGKKESKLMKNFYFWFVLKQVMFLCYSTYGIQVFGTMQRTSFFKTFLNSCLMDVYYEFLLISLINILIRSFKSRYKDLNQKLETACEQSKSVEELMNIANYYRILGDTVEIFNSLFGYQIILVIFDCCLETVSALNGAFLYTINGQGQFNIEMFLCNMSLLTVIPYFIAMIVLSTDSTTQEAKKFTYLCWKYQENFTQGSKELEALEKIASSSAEYFRGFHAAGFFNVSKNLVFSLISNIATYFIITIQLNSSESNQ